MPPTWSFETKLKKKGFKLIAGVDEAGRGPLAGPVVAASVILPPNLKISGLDDSKKVPPDRREELFQKIIKQAVAVGIGIVEAHVIDKINIFQAAFQAMIQAVANLRVKPDYLLIDGPHSVPKINLPQQPIIKGDGLSYSIAAASIIAKVTRDRIMTKLARQFPQYQFDQHKGYATPGHLEAIFKNGLCSQHRQSFCIKQQLTIFNDF